MAVSRKTFNHFQMISTNSFKKNLCLPCTDSRNGRRRRSAPFPKEKRLLAVCFFILCIFLFSVCKSQAKESWSSAQGPYIIADKMYYKIPFSDGFIQKGCASWYGPSFQGHRTSSGELYNMHSLTAAHKTLPMDTVLLVKNLENGKDALVRVNDRGPFAGGRIIDLSYKAARTLGLVDNGTANVQIIALAEGEIKNAGEAPILHYKDFSAGEFYVQIASFANKLNAIRLQKRFADAGHTTVIQQYFNPKALLYQVHVYVGKTIQSAKVAEKALLECGYNGAFVVAR